MSDSTYRWDVIQPRMGTNDDPLGQRGSLYLNGKIVADLTNEFHPVSEDESGLRMTYEQMQSLQNLINPPRVR